MYERINLAKNFALNYLKRLAGQSVVYGLGTIVPRLLNFIVLTPFYTRIFGRTEYGIITELYAYMVVLLIVLTYGLETGFFRHYASASNKSRLYSTLLISLFITSSAFILLVLTNLGNISYILEYQDNKEYIKWFSFIVAIDAFISLPFARLRADNKPGRFAIIKIINVLSILLLSFFILYLGKEHQTHAFWSRFYNPDIGVGYVFLINLVGSIISLILILPEIFKVRADFDLTVLKKVLSYSFPLLIAGLAGAINEAIDRILLKHLITDSDPMEIVGIYGANYKLAVFMTLFIQMFKYAAEPFFFDQSKNKDAKSVYAQVMKYFVVFGLIIFLFVVLYIDVFKYFIGSKFHEGLHIVPIVLFANLLLGIFYNLSVWYKINDLTRFGAGIAIVGALTTLLFNFLLIPVMGYTGCAWTHLICYTVMVLLSYFFSRKYYKINYELKTILFYIFLAVSIVLLSELMVIQHVFLRLSIHTVMFGSFSIFIILREKVINIFIKR